MHADAKALFNLGKCQQRDFSGQIADMTLKLCVYNIMTYIKRITVYETLGGIFSDMTEMKAELCLADKIWGMIMEALSSIKRAFGASLIFDIEYSFRREQGHLRALQLSIEN